MSGAIYGLENLTQTINISTEGSNLFRSTASITQLKTYGDQTFSSMLAGEGGQIFGHAGFEKVGTFSATVSNPVVPLVILTTIIIKQQFDDLNRKLDTITDKLNSVIGMMHAEKLAILQTIDARIKTITQQENISSANLNELAQLANEAQFVFRQYKILLDQYDQSELLKAKGLNDTAKIAYMLKNIQNSDFMMDFKMAYFADSLSWLVRLTIITSLVKSDTDPKIIDERINAFKSEYDQSFSNTAEAYMQKVREPIIEKALTMITKVDTVGDVGTKAVETLGMLSNKIPLKTTKLFGAKTQGFKSHAETVKEQSTIELENEFDKMVQPIFGSSVDDIASSIIHNLTAPKEIIYAIDDSNNVRIFVGESSAAMA